MLTSVAPEPPKDSEEENPKELVNLYDVLDDRFAHEGCCRFLFFSFFFFFIFHLSISATYYADVAGEKSNFKDKLIVPNDQFERKQFNAWGLQLMRDLANDQKYFGDKLEVMRITAFLQPKLCNYKSHHPRGSIDDTYYENSAPKSSFVKTYENVCPVLSSGSGVGKDKEALVLLLKDRYKVYSLSDSRDMRRSRVTVPIFSAEVHELNKTHVASQALNKLESALGNETMLELTRIDVEVLNPFDHLWYYILVDPTDDATTKRLELITRIITTLPQRENTAFVIFFVVSVFFQYQFSRNMLEVNKRNKLYVFVVLVGWVLLVWLGIINFGLEVSPNALMKHPKGTVYRLEDASVFMKQYRNNTDFYLLGVYNQLFTSILLFFLMIIMVNELSWHSGASVLTSTIKKASAALADTLVVVIVLLVGFGGFTYNLFGAFGGSRDFHNFLNSANTIARLSFGLYEYDEYISGGLGPGYEGIGLGNQEYWSYIILWITFIILSTVIVNILIAIVSDGYEDHREEQKLRVKKGETIIEYAYHQLKSILLLCYYRCHQKQLEEQGLGVKKLWFTWSKHSKLLLKHCDIDPDCMVFDVKLQKKVFEAITEGKERIVYTKANAQDFFSNLQSKEMLQNVIEEIVGDNENERQVLIRDSFKQHDVYSTIWNAYKQKREKTKTTLEPIKMVAKDVKRLNQDIAEIKGKVDRILNLLEKRSFSSGDQ